MKRIKCRSLNKYVASEAAMSRFCHVPSNDISFGVLKSASPNAQDPGLLSFNIVADNLFFFFIIK